MNNWYDIQICHGAERDCPHLILDPAPVVTQLIAILDEQMLDPVVASICREIRLPHQRFRIAVAGCPNACSQPQIKDVGLIACARMNPALELSRCTGCNRCVEVCKEQAVSPEKNPAVDLSLCVACGACAAHCDAGALRVSDRGWNVIAGGKLGRHPRLAREVAACCFGEKLSLVVRTCLERFIHKKMEECANKNFVDLDQCLIRSDPVKCLN